jgi:hypothetical protein
VCVGGKVYGVERRKCKEQGAGGRVEQRRGWVQTTAPPKNIHHVFLKKIVPVAKKKYTKKNTPNSP